MKGRLIIEICDLRLALYMQGQNEKICIRHIDKGTASYPGRLLLWSPRRAGPPPHGTRRSRQAGLCLKSVIKEEERLSSHLRCGEREPIHFSQKVVSC